MSEPLAPDTERPFAESNLALADKAFLLTLREQMMRFATLQLKDEHLAEDAVQEALVGTLKNARSFGGKAALKTWVFAILKNKIVDLLRHKQRLVNASSLLRADNDEDEFTLLFDQHGHWRPGEQPQRWGDPEELCKQQQFWHVFELCLDTLPPQQARVFMMREFIELESAEICETVGISPSNLFVILHRARLRLSKCLEHRWFQQEQPS